MNENLDASGAIEIGIVLKHILRYDIKENDFNFYKEIKRLKKIYKSTNCDMRCFKKNLYHAIKSHYGPNNILEKIKFKFNKSNIIKKELYKILDVIIYKIKSTNELVLKEFISAII